MPDRGHTGPMEPDDWQNRARLADLRQRQIDARIEALRLRRARMEAGEFSTNLDVALAAAAASTAWIHAVEGHRQAAAAHRRAAEAHRRAAEAATAMHAPACAALHRQAAEADDVAADVERALADAARKAGPGNTRGT